MKDIMVGRTAIAMADIALSKADETINIVEQELNNDTYILNNPYAHLAMIGQGKQFKCKGKHQYREEHGEWKCECGRNIND